MAFEKRTCKDIFCIEQMEMFWHFPLPELANEDLEHICYRTAKAKTAKGESEMLWSRQTICIQNKAPVKDAIQTE